MPSVSYVLDEYMYVPAVYLLYAYQRLLEKILFKFWINYNKNSTTSIFNNLNLARIWTKHFWKTHQRSKHGLRVADESLN